MYSHIDLIPPRSSTIRVGSKPTDPILNQGFQGVYSNSTLGGFRELEL
jgi:hypothetical protein